MNKLTFLFLCCGIFLFLHTSYAQPAIISLNSSNPHITWEIKPQADVSGTGNEISIPGFQLDNYVKGVVPGVVFTAYVEAGIVPDPNYADNIYKVDESFYNRPFWYRTEFELPSSYIKGQRVWLHFDGTNRFADFYFNGTKLSGTSSSTKDVSGHMIRTKYDITDLVKQKGKNAVAVLITDANEKKRRDSGEPFGITSSPTYLAGAGWDWMPYVPGRLAGITGNAYIHITGDVVMEDPWVRSDLPTLQQAELSVSTDLKNVSSAPRTATIERIIHPGNIRFAKNITLEGNTTTHLSVTKNDFTQLLINNPELWWPNGYGEPNLYTCSLTCSVDGKVSDKKEISFGIKKYEYEMADNKVGMPVMTFYINGQKLFLKGGNWGMSEYLLRCHGKEYETKIRLHKDMNYNMIRLWTGCVTDEEFYDYCDKYGIMVWDDFWIYFSYNEVEQPEAFKANARDKVRRLRNHPSIALWCGANETRPSPELDEYLREMVAQEDHNDRMYKSCSNQDGLSGSGWWGNQPPRHHFETSGSNLAFNDPPYPYGIDYGYGLRTEIGTATFPAFESVTQFIPADQWWPLPTDEQLKEDDDNVWNKHYFGKEASNANPVNYKAAVNTQFGESSGLEEFCEKAQILNVEVMKGMYEAWNDKMWNDASGILIWMSHPAYPSFVWQTYDYYYDATGAYWGAKKACEHLHVQWNSSNNSVKVINTTSNDLHNAQVKATVYDLNGKEMPQYGKSGKVSVSSSNMSEAFTLHFNPADLAYGKNVVASSSTEHRNAALVTDGGAGSRWESEYSDQQWIYVDLGKKEKIERVVLKWEAAHAKEYEVQVSNDTKKWKTVYTCKESEGGTEEIRLKPVAAQYIRLACTSRATDYGYSLFNFEVYGKEEKEETLSPLHFIRLELTDANGNLICDNFYWRNGVKDLDYTQLHTLPEAELSCTVMNKNNVQGISTMQILVKNNSETVAFGNRMRFVNKETQERILPVIMSDNYFTLLPGEEKIISVEAETGLLNGGIDILLKQYGKNEKNKLSVIL